MTAATSIDDEREHVSHRVEVVVVGYARVTRKERVGAEENCHVHPVRELGNGPVVKRRIEKRPHAGEQRKQHATGQPEAVKHGQGVQHHILRIDIDNRRQLISIRQKIAMTQHDTLWRAFRSRGEQDNSRFVGALEDDPPVNSLLK